MRGNSTRAEDSCALTLRGPHPLPQAPRPAELASTFTGLEETLKTGKRRGKDNRSTIKERSITFSPESPGPGTSPGSTCRTRMAPLISARARGDRTHQTHPENQRWHTVNSEPEARGTALRPTLHMTEPQRRRSAEGEGGTPEGRHPAENTAASWPVRGPPDP